MTQTNALIDAALKDFYLPPAREQLNNKTMMLAQIERTSRHVEGRNAVLSLHTGRNTGIGARAENVQLPDAGNQSYVEERVGMAHNYLRIGVTGQVMKATVSDAGSFVRALDDEMTKGTKDLRRDCNRQVFNNTNDTITECGVTAASTTVVLSAATTLTEMRQLEVGMLIDIGTVANPVSVATARSIVSTDRTASPFTIVISGAAVTTAAADFITRTGNAGEELIGLREIVAGSGTLHNVDPTTDYEGWVSYTDDNSGTLRAATDNLFEEAIDEIDLESDESPNFLVVSKGVRRNYAAQLKSQKRFNDGASLTLKGGFKALTVDCGDVTLPIVGERDCPANTAFLLCLEKIIQHEMSDWEWMDKDGAILSRSEDFDRYTATMFKYHQICTDQRNCHGIITDLTEGS